MMKFYEIDIKTTENSAQKVQNYCEGHKHFNSMTKLTKVLRLKKFSHNKFVLDSVDDHTILLDILKSKLQHRPFHQGIACSPTKNPYVWAKPHHDYKLVIFSFISAPTHTSLFEYGDKARNLKIEEYNLLRSYDTSLSIDPEVKLDKFIKELESFTHTDYPVSENLYGIYTRNYKIDLEVSNIPNEYGLTEDP